MAKRKSYKKRSYKKRPYRQRQYKRRPSDQTDSASSVGFFLIVAVVGYMLYQNLDTFDVLQLPWVIGGGAMVILFIYILIYGTWSILRAAIVSNQKSGSLASLTTVRQLQNTDPLEVEAFVVDLFRKLGYSATGTAPGPDGGIDGTLKKNGNTYRLQVKRYKNGNKVSVKDLREFRGVYAKEEMFGRIDGGFFVTTGTFTQPALDWADNEPNLFIWDQEKLSEKIEEANGWR